MLAIEVEELKEENKTIKQRAVAENAAVFKIDEKTQKEKLVWSSDLFEEFGVIK
jgi:FtsZ-binding cell division protein ZapB